jgi:hypothetical protein
MRQQANLMPPAFSGVLRVEPLQQCFVWVLFDAPRTIAAKPAVRGRRDRECAAAWR